jgi:hypothetical protein
MRHFRQSTHDEPLCLRHVRGMPQPRLGWSLHLDLEDGQRTLSTAQETPSLSGEIPPGHLDVVMGSAAMKTHEGASCIQPQAPWRLGRD